MRWLIPCLLAATGQGADLKPGLVGEYYVIGEEFDDFPSLVDRKPAQRRIDLQVAFSRTVKGFGDSGLLDFFCVRWTGMVRVPRAGKYAFFLSSDDGSRLFIDGKLVVNNGGLHGLEEEKGEIDLNAGDHPLKIEFFECGGEAACVLSWESKDVAKERVPPAALLHIKDPSLDR